MIKYILAKDCLDCHSTNKDQVGKMDCMGCHTGDNAVLVGNKHPDGNMGNGHGNGKNDK